MWRPLMQTDIVIAEVAEVNGSLTLRDLRGGSLQFHLERCFVAGELVVITESTVQSHPGTKGET